MILKMNMILQGETSSQGVLICWLATAKHRRSFCSKILKGIPRIMIKNFISIDKFDLNFV